MTETLPKMLELLSQSVVNKTPDYLRHGQLFSVNELYLRTSVEQFQITYGHMGLGQSTQLVPKQKWRWKHEPDFLNQVKMEVAQYDECVNQICNLYKFDKGTTEFYLLQFIKYLAEQHLNDADKLSLVDAVTMFIRDLDQSPITWNLKAKLQGIGLETDSIHLEDGVILRRAIASDYEADVPFHEVTMGFQDYSSKSFSTVLEITMQADNEELARNTLNVFIDVLRLLKLGSVSSVYNSLQAPHSILRLHNTALAATKHIGTYKYKIEIDEVEKVREFIKALNPILFKITANQEQQTSASIAFQRYIDAVLNDGLPESRITSAITCLEALLLKSSERMELTHRLSQRVAALLSPLNLPPLKVYKSTSRAYDIRSTFIHGSPIQDEHRKNLNDLCEEILEYARLTVVIFLQVIKNQEDKDSFINKLDNSLFEEKPRTTIKEMLASIVVPR